MANDSTDETDFRPKRKRSIGRLKGMWKHPKTGRWYYSPTLNGKRKNVNLETKDAEEAFKKAVAISEEPEAIGLPGPLEKEIAAYVAEKTASGEFSRFSSKQRPVVLNQFAKWVGHLPIQLITPKMAADYYVYQKGRVSEKTKRKLSDTTIQSYIVSVIAPFFEWLLKERKVITKNPFVGLKMSDLHDKDKARESFCERELRDAILAESLKVPNDVLEPERAAWVSFVLHVGFEAGLRKNELVEARPCWFSLKQGTITVEKTDTFRPKDKERRTIPISKSLLAFLETYPLEGTWCIAPEVKRGKADYRYDFEKPYKLVMAHIAKKLKKDLSKVTPHIMRHTFASLLAISGVSLYKISKWLGDTLRTTEKHYAHLQAADDDIDRTRATA